MSINAGFKRAAEFREPDSVGVQELPRGLNHLGRLIVAACNQRITPVLITGRSLQLTDEFYVALCQAVHQQCGCHVTLELLPGCRLNELGLVEQWFGPLGISRMNWTFFQTRHKSAVERLNRTLPPGCNSIRTLALSRNLPPLSELVIGLAGEDDHLPSYAKSIELCT